MKQVSNRGVIKSKEEKTKGKKRDSKIPISSSKIANKKNGLKKHIEYVKNTTHPQYGTSKLEEDFAHNFLDKLGVQYEYQFEAKDIGRFYDFFLPKSRILIEIDGDYWHGNPNLYTEDKLKYHQKKAKKIDELKDKWALMHGIPILRFWENDIRKNPKKVLKELKERLNLISEKEVLKENKRKRHYNTL